MAVTKEVVFEKYGWKLVKYYNDELDLYAVFFEKPDDEVKIALIPDLGYTQDNQQLIDRLRISIEPNFFYGVNKFEDYVTQVQEAYEFAQEAWKWIEDNGFTK